MPRSSININFDGSSEGLVRSLRDASRALGRTNDDLRRTRNAFTRTAGVTNNLSASLRNLAQIAGVGLGIGGLLALARGAASFGESLNELSRTLGLTTDELQAMQLAAKLVNVEFPAMQYSMRRLRFATGEAIQGIGEYEIAFNRLGISMQELPFLTTIQLMRRVSAEIERGGFVGTAEGTSIIRRLFGETGDVLTPLLGLGSDNFEAIIDRSANRPIRSGQDLQRLEELNESLSELTTSFGILKDDIIADLAPTITSVADALSTVARGAVDLNTAFVELDPGEFFRALSNDLAQGLVNIFGIEGVAGAYRALGADSPFFPGGASVFNPVRQFEESQIADLDASARITEDDRRRLEFQRERAKLINAAELSLNRQIQTNQRQLELVGLEGEERERAIIRHEAINKLTRQQAQLQLRYNAAVDAGNDKLADTIDRQIRATAQLLGDAGSITGIFDDLISSLVDQNQQIDALQSLSIAQAPVFEFDESALRRGIRDARQRFNERLAEAAIEILADAGSGPAFEFDPSQLQGGIDRAANNFRTFSAEFATAVLEEAQGGPAFEPGGGALATGIRRAQERQRERDRLLAVEVLTGAEAGPAFEFDPSQLQGGIDRAANNFRTFSAEFATAVLEEAQGGPAFEPGGGALATGIRRAQERQRERDRLLAVEVLTGAEAGPAFEFDPSQLQGGIDRAANNFRTFSAEFATAVLEEAQGGPAFEPTQGQIGTGVLRAQERERERFAAFAVEVLEGAAAGPSFEFDPSQLQGGIDRAANNFRRFSAEFATAVLEEAQGGPAFEPTQGQIGTGVLRAQERERERLRQMAVEVLTGAEAGPAFEFDPSQLQGGIDRAANNFRTFSAEFATAVLEEAQGGPVFEPTQGQIGTGVLRAQEREREIFIELANEVLEGALAGPAFEFDRSQLQGGIDRAANNFRAYRAEIAAEILEGAQGGPAFEFSLPELQAGRSRAASFQQDRQQSSAREQRLAEIDATALAEEALSELNAEHERTVDALFAQARAQEESAIASREGRIAYRAETVTIQFRQNLLRRLTEQQLSLERQLRVARAQGNNALVRNIAIHQDAVERQIEGVAETTQQAQQVIEQIARDQIALERDQRESLKRVAKALDDTLNAGLQDAILGTDNLKRAFEELAVSIAEAAIEFAFFGSNGQTPGRSLGEQIVGGLVGSVFDEGFSGIFNSDIPSAEVGTTAAQGGLPGGGGANYVQNFYINNSDEATVRRGLNNALPAIQDATAGRVAQDLTRPSTIRQSATGG